MARHLRLIWILAARGLLELSRMPGILAVIFLPGALLYVVFTMVLPTGNSGGGSGIPQMRVACVDLDHSEASRRLQDALAQMSVRVMHENSEGVELTRADAAHLVEKGHVSAALIVPEGYGSSLLSFHTGGAEVELIIDETQPMAGDILGGMLQMAAGMALMEQFDDLLAQLTGHHILTSVGDAHDEAVNSDDADDAGNTAVSKRTGLIRVSTQGVAASRGDRAPPSSLIYLAGLIPMFLLFNAQGAASAMLTELQTGATRRILAAPVDAGDYLGGHLVQSLVVSLLQVTSMYLLAWVIFHAPIFEFAGGLALFTIATAFATVGFGVLIASVARTAEQLNSIGTVVILAMSALGGSMFPRIFMPDWVKPFGLFTINAWAYDGFVAIIRDRNIGNAIVPLIVLLAAGIACATIGSMLLSRRLRGAPHTS